MNKNSRETKIEFWKEKTWFFVRIAHDKKVCNEKSLQKTPIFCTNSPFCAIFSLYFWKKSQILLPKKGRFSIKNDWDIFENDWEIFENDSFLKKSRQKHPQKTW